MSTVADGTVTVSYRPLTTMDDLHVLLLAAVARHAGGVSLLEQVFSLPPNVLVKEMAVLESYGLVERLGDEWTATKRGQRIAAVWGFSRTGAKPKCGRALGSGFLALGTSPSMRRFATGRRSTPWQVASASPMLVRR